MYYTAFGLSIASELPLPELKEGTSPPTTYIRLGKVPLETPLMERGYGSAWATPTEVKLYYPFVHFHIYQGRCIVVDLVEQEPLETVRAFLLGQALGVLLAQRGALNLHASSIVSHNRAVLFMGKSGMGKSTLAAAFQESGHAFISDDIVPIQVGSSRALTCPGVPVSKLWPSSLDMMKICSRLTTKLHPTSEKRLSPATNQSDMRKIDISTIYWLVKGDSVRIKELDQLTAFHTILSNLYSISLIAPMGLNNNLFKKVSLLAQTVKVYQLSFSHNPEQFDFLKQVIKTHSNTYVY